jgi:ribulose-5-phosphate 4-epimerase/fuculose-1-phosphate aldolase
MQFREEPGSIPGSVIPSSESLTHAAIYEADTAVGAVTHCHDLKLWEVLLNQAPTTSKAAEYGTPELAHEIMRLFKDANAQSRKVVVLAGHESGIVTFGKDLEEAFTVLMCERKKGYL